MQNALKEVKQPHADVFLTILGIHILSVNLNALSILNVQMTRPVSIISVKTLVLECVVPMPHAMLEIIFLNVHVILDILGMPLLHVLDLQHVSFI